MYEDEDLQEIHEDIQELNTDISVLRKDLNNISASVNGSGENVTLNKTAEARFKKLEIGGNSKQIQYTGKNIFDKNNYVVIPEDNALGFDISELTIGEKYTFSTNLPITWFKISTVPTGYNSVQQYNNNGFTTFTFTMSRDANIPIDRTQYLFIALQGFDTIKNINDIANYNIQIEEGTTATSYEPYTGGIASPNPSYPQEIGNAGILPIEYQQVEYIESTGTQYIDTDIVGQDGLKLITKLQIDSYPRLNTPLIGSYGNSSRCYLPIINKDGKIGLAYRETTWSDTAISNQPNVVEINIEVNNQYLKLNDTLLISNKDSESLSTSRDIFIFGYNNSGSFDSSYPASFKLYYSKIYKRTNLVRNFIPCYRKSDNEIGLYDTVNNIFYTNQGTGTFLKGNNVNEINTKIQNKNWFDSSVSAAYKHDIQINYIDDGYVLTATGGAGYSRYAEFSIKNWQKLLGKTIKISFDAILSTGNAGAAIRIGYRQQQGYTWINIGDVKSFTTNGKVEHLVTLPNEKPIGIVEAEGIDLFFNADAGQAIDTTLTLKNIQVELGSTATSYTPHAEQNFTLPCQQPMRSTSIARDIFFKNVVGSEYYNTELIENAWYERHIIASKTFNGSNDEGWLEKTNAIGTKQFYCATGFSYIQTLVHQADVQLCNYATYFYGAYNYGTPGKFSVLDNVRQVFICVDDEVTLEQWKTKLASKNLEVLCALRTPTYLPCTAAQVEVLEAITKADSYSEQTNISSPDAVSPVYTVTAFRDMNATVENLQARIDLLNN